MNERADILERAIGGVTEPVAGAGAWRAALERVRGEPASHRLFPTLSRPVSPGLGSIAAVLLIGAVLAVALVPSLGRARRSAMPPPEAAEAGTPRLAFGFDDGGVAGSPSRLDDVAGDGFALGVPTLDARVAGIGIESTLATADPRTGDPRATDGASAVRHVVRKATVELVVGDVRAAFVRANQLVRPARGEYVQDSQSRDRGDGVLEADLVLRVEAGRLGEVLNELRTLGDVRHERTDADDVTGQVVDLDARLRTQRAVEAELLGLLEDRADADLDGVIKVRRELASVREQIERMEGQRQQVGALVRLATVAVVLRQDAEPEPEPEEQTLGAWFGEQMTAAWGGGVRTLLGTLAWFVEVAVGGLVWWVVVIVAFAFAWRAWRRGHPRALPERA